MIPFGITLQKPLNKPKHANFISEQNCTFREIQTKLIKILLINNKKQDKGNKGYGNMLLRESTTVHLVLILDNVKGLSLRREFIVVISIKLSLVLLE